MKKETSDKLKSAFDKYDKKRQEIKEDHEKIKSEHELFLENFDRLISEVIRPTMEELSAAIKSRGHASKISQSAESRDSQGRTTPARIQMEIYPGMQQPKYSSHRDVPSISFIAETHSNKIWTHVSTMMLDRGGSAGKRNEYTPESITAETVENEVVHLVHECFGK